MNIISVREQPQYTQQIIAYLQQCWNKMAPILYSDCISHCVDAVHSLPHKHHFLGVGMNTNNKEV